MPFKDFDEFSGGPLRLPIKGKIYEIDPPTAAVGLKMLAAYGGEATDLNNLGLREFWALLLGRAGEQMIEDGVPYTAYDRAGLTVLVDFNAGREAAEQVWESGLPPEALAATLAAIQNEAKASETSTSTASETVTPPRASTSSTTSPKGTRRVAQQPGKAPRGKRSSSTGRS